MSNEITEVITKNKLEQYLQIAGVAQNLTADEQKNFLQIAMDFNLNPFKREIYCTSYGKGENKKTSIIIGYEVYIKRAERTGQLDGWQVVTTGSVKNNDLKATITIYRKDRKFPFIHEVDYSEYVQMTTDYNTKQQRPNKMWEEKPITMLKKVATAQGFRLCFSDELGGMPYDSSELPGNEEREIIISSHNKQIETNSDLPKKPETKVEIQTVMTSTGHTMIQEKSFDNAMLDAQSEIIEGNTNIDWDQPQSEENYLPEIGSAADKADVNLFFEARKNKNNDFLDKYPGMELCKSSTGKYVFQPLGTYAANKK